MSAQDIDRLRAWARRYVEIFGAGLHVRADVLASLGASLAPESIAARALWMIAIRAKIIRPHVTDAWLVQVCP